jgi:hypothetical protein
LGIWAGQGLPSGQRAKGWVMIISVGLIVFPI